MNCVQAGSKTRHQAEGLAMEHSASVDEEPFEFDVPWTVSAFRALQVTVLSGVHIYHAYICLYTEEAELDEMLAAGDWSSPSSLDVNSNIYADRAGECNCIV